MGFPFCAGLNVVIGCGVGRLDRNADGAVSDRGATGSVFGSIPVGGQIVVDAVIGLGFIAVLFCGGVGEIEEQIAGISNKGEIVQSCKVGTCGTACLYIDFVLTCGNGLAQIDSLSPNGRICSQSIGSNLVTAGNRVYIEF